MAVLFVLGVILLACGQGPVTSDRQQTVDALAALLPERIPAHLQQRDAIKDGSEFDPNRYFSVLTRLSMESGYVLDYAYYYDGFAGLPMLYARPAGQAPYATYDDYARAVDESARKPLSYLDHVRADGTPESFFQLVLLRIAGGQFYLFWHANYNDAQVICDRSGLEALIATLQASDLNLPDDVLAQARALDLEPVVEFQGDGVRVRLVTFSLWSGFSEETYLLSRESPHKVLDAQTKVLVAYDSGIQF
jgi:hypothetical protein